MRRGVAKICSELVALRLLYTVIPIIKTKLKVVCFLRAGHSSLDDLNDFTQNAFKPRQLFNDIR